MDGFYGWDLNQGKGADLSILQVLPGLHTVDSTTCDHAEGRSVQAIACRLTQRGETVGSGLPGGGRNDF
jgi:hypothetical protein